MFEREVMVLAILFMFFRIIIMQCYKIRKVNMLSGLMVMKIMNNENG